MTTVQDVTDLDTAPAVPGGGPARRWRLSRITSAFAWVWFGLMVACPLAAGVVVVTSVHQGHASDSGVTTLFVLGIAFVILLCGVGAAGMAAVEGRVDDDMREYGVGRRAALGWRRGAAGLSVDAPVRVDGVEVGCVERGFVGGEFRNRLVLGVQRWRWSVRPGRLALIPANGHEGADAEPAALAVAHPQGKLRDWEIEVDGRVFRVRVHAGRPLPRRTLVDERGRAWLVRCGSRSVEGRLPAGLSPPGAAFCLLVLAELAEITGANADGVGGGGGWSDSDSSGADWFDWSSSDWSSSDGSSPDTGSSWSDSGSSWTDSGSSWSGGDSGGGWSW